MSTENTPLEVIQHTLERFCNVEQDQEAKMVFDALEAEGYRITKVEPTA